MRHLPSRVSKPIDIIAIEERTAIGNGISRPFRCIGEDNHEYFVKLRNVGWNHLVKEWIAGRLAHEMGLPAADIAQVRIPRELIDGNAELETELGHGIAFGSRLVGAAERLALAFVREDSDGTLSRILLFDRWVRNSDRALTVMGGNPNLLWQHNPGRIVIFDHDNAFEETFDQDNFWKLHALRAHRSAWETDQRIEMLNWLASGTDLFNRFWNELPEEWLNDSYGDPRCTLDKRKLHGLLKHPQTEPDFWSLPAPL